ncbi:histidine phosphatase family protein [Nocardia sp. XZ_19_369]|uniref:histidine phosphatase family protein n=1 Tax=Nocardia sp. XZ_19_369 TaxID=2769487 RepID=UPI0027D31DF3|nr:histidine phosphatase family protein [Nocardia sp. XZ_19_369]
MSGFVRVWCLRHAESENVVAGVSGAVPLSPLTSCGFRQAEVAARVQTDEPITGVYCSTALRTRQTAAALCKGRSIDTVALPELVEVGIGAAEATTDPDVRRQTAEVLRRWIVDRQLERRVADGESGTQVLARMTTALEQIRRAHEGESVVLVGHVASLSVTLAQLCGLGARVWGHPLPHAAPFLVEWDGRSWQCRSWPALPTSGVSMP